MDELAKMGGVRREEIDGRFGRVEEHLGTLRHQIAIVERDFNRLDAYVCGNGKPGLEKRAEERVLELLRPIRERLEQIVRHTDRNIEQGDSEISNEAKRLEKKVEAMDDRNVKIQEATAKELNSFKRVFWMVAGAAGVLHFLGLDNLSLLLKK